jgi:hypothetical protein
VRAERKSIVESPLENRGEWSVESYEKNREVRCAQERTREALRVYNNLRVDFARDTVAI